MSFDYELGIPYQIFTEQNEYQNRRKTLHSMENGNSPVSNLCQPQSLNA